MAAGSNAREIGESTTSVSFCGFTGLDIIPLDGEGAVKCWV